MGDGKFLGTLLTDAPDDTANQVVNCSAFDWTGEEIPGTGHAKDSDRWKNPGPGVSVSPDDLLSWDRPSPEGEGIYGYSEPLVFRPGRYVRVYRWAPSEGTGDVQGVVRFRGSRGGGGVVRHRGRPLDDNRTRRHVLIFGMPSGHYAFDAQAVVTTREAMIRPGRLFEGKALAIE